jgi:hypothetical protein
VYVFADGTLKRVRVCSACAKQVISVFVGGAPTFCSCGEPATRCAACSQRVAAFDRRKLLKGAAVHLVNIAKAYESSCFATPIGSYERGQRVGLERAADLVIAFKPRARSDGES